MYNTPTRRHTLNYFCLLPSAILAPIWQVLQPSLLSSVYITILRHVLLLLKLVFLPPTKEEVNAFVRVRLFVCLSVSKITQKRVH